MSDQLGAPDDYLAIAGRCADDCVDASAQQIMHPNVGILHALIAIALLLKDQQAAASGESTP